MNDAATHLFSPLKLRGVTLPNRIVVSPMCQYSSVEGMAGDWHLVHLGCRAIGGAGLVFTEAAAVAAEGRISPQDLGIWREEQIAPLERITAFLHAHGAHAGMQLAHAGRKASMAPAWMPTQRLSEAEGGWSKVVGPSPVAYAEKYAVPQELDREGIRGVTESFAAAAGRALRAGFDVLELHAAHGYLLHEFLSPLSNHREDEYGGSFVNRCRLLMEVVKAVRAVWPQELPLWVRISATDWAPDRNMLSWDVEQSVTLAKMLKTQGVDVVDCSSGGNMSQAQVPVGPGYQVPFAARIRREAGVATAAVGLITQPEQADGIIREGEADLVMMAREMLRDPYWPLHAARALGQTISWPVQYLRAAEAGTPQRTAVTAEKPA